MTGFINESFLLSNETARLLYHDYAASLPIIDYHSHIDAEDIAVDRRYPNITHLWLAGDHYKWRLMRLAGVGEHFITGAADDYDKFFAFARTLPQAIGNPVYHFTHLELKRYFDCDYLLTAETAATVWELCNEKLGDDDMTVRGIIEKSKVTVIGTTDDPCDSLRWHQELAADDGFAPQVLPTFRPDGAVDIDKPTFRNYISTLGEKSGVEITSLTDLYQALQNRLDFFAACGCVMADHGLSNLPYLDDSIIADNTLFAKTAADIFAKSLHGEVLRSEECEIYQTAILLFLAREYHRRGWVMQLHLGALRDVNPKMAALVGANSGFDAIRGDTNVINLAKFLAWLETNDALPKTILYSLNPADDPLLVAVAACFPGEGIAAKVQHGSAWWFNDTLQGIEAQLTNLASRGLVGSFLGMLTDSRSFLSYSRHEYFRRILCNLLGTWAERGECTGDKRELGQIIKSICHDNAAAYFGFTR
ncbi:MAG: glucuronate isomerase [Lachnospiraceae bacterium]|jgi:glucuronate isomerase|nr:glucuronate isomerase [Lachnospiraceae bacterium]